MEEVTITHNDQQIKLPREVLTQDGFYKDLSKTVDTREFTFFPQYSHKTFLSFIGISLTHLKLNNDELIELFECLNLIGNQQHLNHAIQTYFEPLETNQKMYIIDKSNEDVQRQLCRNCEILLIPLSLLQDEVYMASWLKNYKAIERDIKDLVWLSGFVGGREVRIGKKFQWSTLILKQD